MKDMLPWKNLLELKMQKRVDDVDESDCRRR